MYYFEYKRSEMGQGYRRRIKLEFQWGRFALERHCIPCSESCPSTKEMRRERRKGKEEIQATRLGKKLGKRGSVGFFFVEN